MVDGEEWPGDNPRLVLDPEWFAFVRLWGTCRGENGVAHWPALGGVEDQAAWIVDAFETLEAANAKWREKRRKEEGG